MRRFTTTVALDEETAELVQQIPNFSEWVRNQLRQEAGKAGVGTHTKDPKHRVRGKCNPMGKNPCRVCWPEGAPSKDDWFAFRKGLIDEIDSSYQQRMKHFTQQAFSRDVSKEKSTKAISSNHEQIGIIRRFWRWVF
mgnify:FL=1